MTKIINLTPHDINIISEAENRTFPASGSIARVSQSFSDAEPVDGVPCQKQELGKPEGLPEPEDGTYYIVSSFVASAAGDRNDLLVPNTGRAIRDEKGHIIGVPGFIRP